MPGIRVPVSASADRSLSVVFAPLIAASAAAKAKLKTDAEARAAADEKAAQKAMAAAAKAYAQIEALSAKATAKEESDTQKAAQAKVKAAQKVFDEKLRLVKREADAEEREILRTAKAAEARERRMFEAGQKRDKGERESRGMAIAKDAFQTFGGVARAGAGVAMDAARGAGVRLDFSEYVGKAVSAETKATGIVNQAEMAGQAQGPGAAQGLVSKARAVADAAKVDANAALDVLAAFQAKSSDLKTGEDVLEPLAKLAKISGTSFEDMGKAAGAVNAQLEATPDRAQRLLAIISHITKQTADGSVEMGDYAKYVGVIAAQANAYEGSFDKNIGQLGALSQMAMKGGAYSAAMATGSAASFNKDITKSATLEKWTGAGINVFADEKREKLKDVEELIIAYTKSKGADRAELAQFFPNVVSKRAVESSLDSYSKAGGGAAGEAAIRAEFAKFRSTLDQGTVDKLYKNQEGTTANKVQDFNNKLEAIAASAADRLLPALEKLAPRALEVADGLGKLVGWAAENPGSAIGAAIVGSIAKAAIGNMVSGAVEKLIQGAAGSAAGSAGLTIAVAAATFMLGKTAIDEAFGGKEKGESGALEAEARRANLITQAEKELREKGGLSASTRKQIEEEEADVTKRIAGAQDQTGYAEALFTGKTFEDVGANKADAGMIDVLKAQEAKFDALIAAVKGNKTVSVDNMPAPAGPTVDAGARSKTL